jgi:hypothetical protein
VFDVVVQLVTDSMPRPTLLPAETMVARWRSGGGTTAVAIDLVAGQVEGLAALVEDDDAWAHLVRIARQTGDPWLATDWPEAFDPLVLVIALCQRLDWQCAQCPLGATQGGIACANPAVPVTQIGVYVVEGDRLGAREALARLRQAVSTLR